MNFDEINFNDIKYEDFSEFLKKTKIKKLYDMKKYFDDNYYNDESKISDEKYDLLVDEIKKKDKDFIEEIGAKIRENGKRIELPYWMGSANKITPELKKELNRWIKNNSETSEQVENYKKYIITEKLDGVSCLLYKKGNRTHLFTRGDGKIGTDISHLKKFLNLPEINEDITIRGELIIKKDNFKKYKNYKNARNMVSGIISSKSTKKGLDDICFVCYEIIEEKKIQEKQENQLKKLENFGFKIAKNILLNKINIDVLSTLYDSLKNKSEFIIDGIIVQSNFEYVRNISGNPNYMFAFKMNKEEDIFETEVIDIEWNVSKWGQLKPVVIVNPVDVSGITINRATAHSAKFIIDNNLGPNSIIKITRSKDVIPYIVSIVKSSYPKMPERNFVWDDNHVNILICDQEDKTKNIKIISDFFKKLDIKFISDATVSKMYNHGFDTLFKIIEADEKSLLQIPTFKKLTVDKIIKNIKKGLQNMNLSTVIAASCVLGYGIAEKKIESLLNSIPTIFSDFKNFSIDENIDRIKNVEGFSIKSAKKIAENLDKTALFIEKLSKYGNFKTKIESNNLHDSSLSNFKLVMSGFRDKNLEEKIKQKGGKCLTSVSKNTNILITDDINSNSEKIMKAKKLGILIFEKSNFIEKYLT